MAIQEIFLPFLRVASLLKYHLFSVEFPKQMASINCKSKKYHSMVLNFALFTFLQFLPNYCLPNGVIMEVASSFQLNTFGNRYK